MPTSTMTPTDPTCVTPFRRRQLPPGVVVGPQGVIDNHPGRPNNRKPGYFANSLFGTMGAEWVIATTTTQSRATVRSWAAASAALAGYTVASEVLDDIDNGDAAAKDAKLAALIALAQDGDRFAARTVLQAMLPKLSRLAHYVDSNMSADRADRTDDSQQTTVLTFLTVLDRYPVDRRPTTIAGNLALDTLNEITRARRTAPAKLFPVINIDDIMAAIGTRYAHHNIDRATQPHVGDELGNVLGWAVSTGAVTAADADLLTAVYAPEPGQPGGPGDAATSRGLTPAAVRQRCHRATRAIRLAVLTALAEPEAA